MDLLKKHLRYELINLLLCQQNILKRNKM